MDTYGIIGYPIKHSLSPAMHNAAFKALGMEDKAGYEKFEVKPEGLEDFLLNRTDVLGFNVTIPHKVRAREILQKRFHVVKNSPLQLEYLYYDNMSGAVNTVKRNGDDIEYCNTDPIGFRHSLENDLKFKTKGKNVLIIGCGGASRAIVADLSGSGHYIRTIYLYDIDRKVADSTKGYYSNLTNKIKFIYDTKEMLKLKDEFDLLINASPVGMEEGDDRLPVDKSLLRKGLYVFDLVYNRKTRLFKDALSSGCRVIDGRGMLAAQGAFSFSLWTGVAPLEAVDTMRDALNKALTFKPST